MFIRRLFYNRTTGEALHSYMMQGDLRPIPAADEAEMLGLSDYAFMEWTDPDAQAEANFLASSGRVSVDVSQETPVLVFDFSPLELEDETADMLAALETLGYTEG